MRFAAPNPKTVRVIRKLVQVLALLLFLVLFLAATFLNPLRGIADLFYRFDPLVALTAILAGRAWIAGFALAGITLLATLFFGRVWCGWICPMGTALDLLSPSRRPGKRSPRLLKIQPPSDRWRVIKYVLLAFLVFAALLGNQTFIIFDPITILTRTTANAIWPALRSAVFAIEAFLYQFNILWSPLDAVHNAIVYPLFGDGLPVYLLGMPIFFFFAGIVALNWITERFWCRYLCPLGGLLGLVSRFAFFRRVVGDSCTGCAACSRHCPTGTIDPGRNYASDPAECTVCYDCIASCTKGGSSFGWHSLDWKSPQSLVYNPGRREFLGALGGATIWTALAGVEPIRKRLPPFMVRPPGAAQVNFEALCIRCNECVRICPTQGLQPSLIEGGWQNLLTPRLVPRLGYCSYNCNACGLACPTGAIPSLTLEQKRHAPIGLARVDRTRCLPWAYNIDCIVCEEACPIGDKAIKLETEQVANAAGELVTMKRPYVVKERCIGCGMCEYQCPMGGDAAIRVYAYTDAGGYTGDAELSSSQSQAQQK